MMSLIEVEPTHERWLDTNLCVARNRLVEFASLASERGRERESK